MSTNKQNKPNRIVRKMSAGEHDKTRPLWEQVFEEDTPDFLDYYYKFKARDNQIYVVEDNDKICAMLQLNPYKMNLRNKIVNTNYIIAVATDPLYRHQGLMRQLLTKSLCDMYDNGEPITFLMPAAKEIYLPFDFRYIYNQVQMTFNKGNGKTVSKMHYRMADEDDTDVLAEFTSRWLEDMYEVYTVREEAYYHIMLKEQACQDGGIVIIYDGEKMVGHVSYAYGTKLELRELIILEEYKNELCPIIAKVFPDEEEVGVIGLPEQYCYCNTFTKPMIMVRIVHLIELAGCLRASELLVFELAVVDPLIEQNNGRFLWEIDESGGRITKLGEAFQDTELGIGVDSELDADADIGLDLKAASNDPEQTVSLLTIAQLTSLFFGYESISTILEQGKGYLDDALIDKLTKIDCFHKIFINEVV